VTGTESDFEETTLERLHVQGYDYAFGPNISRDPKEVVLEDRLWAFLKKRYPEDAAKIALKVFTRPDGLNTKQRNRNFILSITRGIDVPFKTPEGEERTVHCYPIDWEDPAANEFLAVNQFSITGNPNRRPDIIVFINGLPLIIFELKSPYSEYKDCEGAHNQLCHYLESIPQLFDFNAFCVVSDGIKTLHGVPEAGFEWWAEWKSINGTDIVQGSIGSMKCLVEGLLPKERLLAYIRSFVLFESVNEKITKKAAKYHQFYVVRHAVENAVQAFRHDGDPRLGVVWHTQGSGKSLEMVFLVALLRRELDNPTFVIQVDRNVLDEQLFDQFVAAKDLVGSVDQADSIDNLRELLRAEAGQVIFSTIQKFSLRSGEMTHPILTTREDVIVIADEAHRSQYGLLDGSAYNLRQALPNAKFLGFTGTPIDFQDADTRAVFGEYIEPIYDIPHSVDDGSTVKLFYEARLAKLHLTNPAIDAELQELTECEELTEVERKKARWAQLEAAAGSKDRVRQVAADIVAHYDKRCETQFGKALIVCMSRRNCVSLYDEIVKLRPEWQDPELNKGAIKVVMTSVPEIDPVEWNAAGHVTGMAQRQTLAERMRDPDDQLRIAIVRDMWLTGYDAPVLNTLYVDKPMKGHNLMQAIARVNRVFRDKPGGLIVDYIGIAEYLKDAAAKYTKGGGRGNPAPPLDEEAMAIFLDALDEVRDLVSEDCSEVGMLGHIEQEDMHHRVLDALLKTNQSRDAFLQMEKRLSAAASLVMHLTEARVHAAEVVLYQRVRVSILKIINPPKGDKKKTEEAIRDLVDRSLVAEGVVDLFEVAGLERVGISILDEEFLEQFATKQYPNLRLRLLEKLIADEISIISRKNPIKAKSFREMLEKTLERYHNKALIDMRKQMDADDRFKVELGFTDEEVAFYDALVLTEGEVHDQPFLADLVREIVPAVKKNLKPDWTKAHRSDVQATIRTAVKAVLRRKGVKASDFDLILAKVFEQAEAIYREWPVEMVEEGPRA
jgi:type I restriction enzyme R subunit